MPNEAFLSERLNERKEKGIARSLKSDLEQLVDFCSNDYLGFAKSSDQKNLSSNYKSGSGASRLLRGQSSFFSEVESQIAQFHEAETALIFNSGYDANLGLFSSLLQNEDVCIYDESIHASVIDGIRLSKGHSYPFRHQSVEHLKKRLSSLSRAPLKFVAIESVYSMDGSIAPLSEILSVCESYGAHLIVDEAHATGVIGQRGRGLVHQKGLQKKIFARNHTFGKAIGSHGAAILGSEALKDYLVNFARSFIYTTALPEKSLKDISDAYTQLEKNSALKFESLKNNISFFKNKIEEHKIIGFLQSETPIQSLIISDTKKLISLSRFLNQNGFDVRPILYPTVSKSTQRLRICLHAFNTQTEIENLILKLKTYEL